jgi:hypothetical protein
MKTKILLAACVAVFLFSAFTVLTDKNKAVVSQIEGYYIFTDCKPEAEYIYLGEVHTPAVNLFRTQQQYTDIRNLLIKKAKKEYPRADGLIFTMVSGGQDKCEAVQFK